MGKTGKERKKRKMLNEIAAASGGASSGSLLSTSWNNNLQQHPSKKQRPNPDSSSTSSNNQNDASSRSDTNPGRKQHAPVHNPIDNEDLQTTIKVLHTLSARPELLRQPSFKVLRTVLYNIQKSSTSAGINAGESHGPVHHCHCFVANR
jgi:hypothetical protein